MSQNYLSPSDTSLVGAVNLSNVAGVNAGGGIYTVKSGLHAPPPMMKRFGSSSSAAATSDDGSGYENRTVTLDLYIAGASGVQLHELRRSIQKLLDLATRSTGTPGGHWIGTPITLWASELDSPNFVQFDVLYGQLVEKERDFGPAAVQYWTLALTCLPLARGAVILDTQTAAMTNGLAGFMTRLAVPGDARALCQVTLSDASTSNGTRTPVLQGGRIGVRSLRGGAPFTPVVGVAAVSPGTTFADVTATGPLNGASTARLTTTNAWQKVAVATVSAGDAHGLLDLYPHIRDSSTSMGSPTNLSLLATYGSGSLTAGTYMVAVTEVDGSGHETAASAIMYATTTAASGSIVASWNVSGSPSNQRVYVGASGTWGGYFATGSTAGTYTLTTTAGATFVAAPPTATDPLLLPVQMRLSVGLNVTDPIWSVPGPVFTRVIAGGRWELLYGGTFVCPPMPRQEGAADLGWKVLLEARALGTAFPTLDCDGLWIFPHEESQTVAEYPGLQNPNASGYVIDTRRDGRTSGMVTDLSAPPVPIASITPRGPLTLGPGDNTIIFALEDTAGVVDVTHLKFKAQLRIVPRYIDVIGLVS